MDSDEAKKQMLIGGLICLAGIAVTAWTYSVSAGGGRYVIAWGAIIFGGIRFFRGYAALSGNGD